MKNRLNPIFASLIVIGSAAIAQADTYNWNGLTTGGVTGISDTWDTATANWTGFGTTWPTAGSDNDASFGGTAGTVGFTGDVSVNDIAFSVTAYKLGADGVTNTITLNGTTPTITTASTGGGTIDIGAKLSGSAGLTKKGAVTLQLRNAANNYTGDTRVLQGTLLIGLGNNRLPTGTKLILGDGVTNANGVFQMNGRSQQVAGLETAGTGTGNRVFNGSGTISTFTVANTTDQSFGGILGLTSANENNFNFTKSAAGRLILTASNSFTGTTTISGGILELGHATNTLADTAPVNVNAGTLDIADKTDTIGALTVTSGSITGTTGILSAPSCAGKAGTVSAILASSINLSGTATTWLTKDTAGTLELSAANTFTGNITVTLGRLTLSNSQALGSRDGTDRKGLISQGSGRTVWLKGGITLPSYLDIFVSSNSGDGGGINNESGNNQIQGPIFYTSGNPALNISSASGALTIAGSITLTIDVTDRNLILGGASAADNTISGVIGQVASPTRSLPVVKQGAGKWILSGANNYTGDTTVNGGTLVFGSGGSTRFIPKADASSNKITGNATGLLTLDGALNIELTDAAAAPDTTSWLLVDVANVGETYGPNFTVTGFTESPTGTWTKTVSPSTYTFTELDGRLVKTAAATNTYANWLITNSPATGFVTDSDNDGVANGVENVLGSNPNVYSGGLTDVSATASSATYKHTLNPTVASDVSYSYQWSTDLVEWKATTETNTGGTTATITPSAPVSGVVTVTTAITSGPAAKLFTRIKTSQP